MLNGRKLSYTYDDLGRQTARIFSNEPGDYAAWEQHWDGLGQLKKVELVRDEGVREILRRVTFKYDPFGRRIEKKTVYSPDTTPETVVTTFVYDREDIIYTETDLDGVVSKTHYIHGPGIDEPLAMVRDGVDYYYHADGLGSIVAITDAGQNVVQRYSYESFGRVKVSNRAFKDIYTYTGREWDKEVALHFYRARYYDYMTGRFISKDPIGFSGGDVNLYRYVGNGPVVWIDPYGLFEWVNPITFWAGVVDMGIGFYDMVDAGTIGADAYFHCRANCEASRRGEGGFHAAVTVSEIRENTQENTPESRSRDESANFQGQCAGRSNPEVDCYEACSDLLPSSGIPGRHLPPHANPAHILPPVAR